MKRKSMTNTMTEQKHLGGGFIKEKKTSDRDRREKTKCLFTLRAVCWTERRRSARHPFVSAVSYYPGSGEERVSREQSLRHTQLGKKVGHVHTNVGTRLGAFHLGRERLRTT